VPQRVLLPDGAVAVGLMSVTLEQPGQAEKSQDTGKPYLPMSSPSFSVLV